MIWASTQRRLESASPPNSSSSVSSQRTWPFSQDFKVFLQYSHYGIPRNDHRSGSHSHGSHETCCYQRLAPSILCQGSTFLPWFCELLLKIHSQLLQHHHTNHPPHSKGPPLVLDRTPAEGFRLSAYHFLVRSSPLYPRCFAPLFTHDRCFPPRSRRSLNAT